MFIFQKLNSSQIILQSLIYQGAEELLKLVDVQQHLDGTSVKEKCNVIYFGMQIWNDIQFKKKKKLQINLKVLYSL